MEAVKLHTHLNIQLFDYLVKYLIIHYTYYASNMIDMTWRIRSN